MQEKEQGNRDRTVRVTVTAGEAQLLRWAALTAGASVSTWVRMLAVRAAREMQQEEVRNGRGN